MTFQDLNAIITEAASELWGWPMIFLLLGTHLYLTLRLRFPQRRIFHAIRLSFTRDKDAEGDVSQFGALATSLAATIGTGNIVGVATAVSLGGPGAVLWCWITGVFGMATKYSEGLLAVKYRVKTKDGRMLGGPMFALERGLHAKWLAILFALLTAIAAFGIGNTVQANSISMLLNETYGVSQTAVGLILALMVLLVIVFFIYNKTRFGKDCRAIGAGETSAVQSGVHVERTKFFAFLISGITCGVVAVMTLIRTGSAAQTTGANFNFNVMMALVLGGTLMSGGNGVKVRHAAIGAALLIILQNGLVLWGIDARAQDIIKGVLFIIMIVATTKLSNRVQR